MKTVLTHIPKGWETKRLGDLCLILKRGKSPVYSDINEGVVVVNQDCIRWEFIDISRVKFHKIPHNQNVEFLLRTGDILLNSTGTGTIGRLNQWNNNNLIAFADSHVTVLRLNSDLISPIFVKYFLSNFEAQAYLEAVCFTGSTNQIELSRRYLFKMEFPYPSNPSEQTAIASILSKVDEAILATQNSIKAAEKLKKALMQNLLTGKLKPDGTWRTEDEFYMDEKFGKVPNGWKVMRIKELTICLDSKRKPIKSEDRSQISGVYRYYGAAGIIDYINDYIFEGRYLLFGEDGENLISRKRPQAFIVEGKFWVNNHAHILEAIDGISDLDYLCYQLEYKNYENIVYGSAQPKINKSDLGKIKVLTPIKTAEQKYISHNLKAIDKTIDEKQEKTLILQRLKKSLMQNLLTGKVRVDVEKINELLNL